MMRWYGMGSERREEGKELDLGRQDKVEEEG